MGDAPMSQGPHEPPAEMRSAAAGLRSLFLALTSTGFTEEQALKIVGFMLSNRKD